MTLAGVLSCNILTHNIPIIVIAIPVIFIGVNISPNITLLRNIVSSSLNIPAIDIVMIDDLAISLNSDKTIPKAKNPGDMIITIDFIVLSVPCIK